MRKIIYIILISIVLFLIGFVNYINFQNIITENVKGVTFVYEKMNTQFLDSLKFGILCGICPTIFNLIWNKFKPEKAIEKLISMIAFISVIAIYFFTKISKIGLPKVEIEKLDIKNSITFESQNFPMHFLFAQIFGFLIVYLILKMKPKIEKQPTANTGFTLLLGLVCVWML